MSDSWLIVGLGNPGDRYAKTRHNVGQMVVDELARRRGVAMKRHRSAAMVAQTFLSPGADRIVLAKPLTFMNVSGAPVASLASYFGTPSDRVIVVHDELDIPFDTIRIKSGGGHGGHNGLRDVAAALNTPDYLRVRVGIGRPPGRMDPADWVLAPFGSTERTALPVLIADAADAVESLVERGLVETQQRFHAPR